MATVRFARGDHGLKSTRCGRGKPGYNLIMSTGSSGRLRLAAILGRIEALLADNGGTFWANHVSLSRAAVEASDAWGLEKFLGLLGGMGSLNDYVLYRGSEPLVVENDELHSLLGEAAELAWSLNRAQD